MAPVNDKLEKTLNRIVTQLTWSAQLILRTYQWYFTEFHCTRDDRFVVFLFIRKFHGKSINWDFFGVTFAMKREKSAPAEHAMKWGIRSNTEQSWMNGVHSHFTDEKPKTNTHQCSRQCSQNKRKRAPAFHLNRPIQKCSRYNNCIATETAVCAFLF